MSDFVAADAKAVLPHLRVLRISVEVQVAEDVPLGAFARTFPALQSASLRIVRGTNFVLPVTRVLAGCTNLQQLHLPASAWLTDDKDRWYDRYTEADWGILGSLPQLAVFSSERWAFVEDFPSPACGAFCGGMRELDISMGALPAPCAGSSVASFARWLEPLAGQGRVQRLTLRAREWPACDDARRRQEWLPAPLGQLNCTFVTVP
jgi:hypothetical protein